MHKIQYKVLAPYRHMCIICGRFHLTTYFITHKQLQNLIQSNYYDEDIREWLEAQPVLSRYRICRKCAETVVKKLD